MSKCPNCGNSINSNDKFCMRCGYKIEQPTVPSNQTQNGFQAAQSFEQAPDLNQTSNTAEVTPPPVSEQYVYEQSVQQENTSTNINEPVNFAQQQNYTQPTPAAGYNTYSYTPKKSKTVPIIIGLAAVLFIAIAAVSVFFLTRPTDRTPDGAVKIAINDFMKDMRAEMLDEADDFIAGSDSPDASKISDLMIDMYDSLLDTVTYKIRDVEIDGKSATVVVEFSIADADRILDDVNAPDEDNLQSVKRAVSEAKRRIKAAGTITDSVEIELEKKGDIWVIDDDIEYYMDRLF